MLQSRTLVILVSLVGALFLTAGVGTVAAQSASVVEMNETFEGGGNDFARSVVQTSDGGFALAGSVSSFDSEDKDVWLIKTDGGGNIEINKTFGGEDNDFARSVVQTSDGGFALASNTFSFGSGEEDIWLIKTDANGNIEFTKTFGGARFDGTASIVETSDGGFALAGYRDADAWLIKTDPNGKTDSNGNEEFNRTFDRGDDDRARSVVQTPDGGFALAGQTFFSFGGDEAWLIKTDANGNEEFNRTFGGGRGDFARSVVQTPDGGFALAGKTSSFGSGLGDVWLAKTDANGNEEFNRTFGGADRDTTWSIIDTSDGGLALGAATESFDQRNRDGWLLKILEKPNFEVTISNTNSPVEDGDPLTATATVTNAGDKSGTQTITAEVPGVGSSGGFISLRGGESETVTLNIQTNPRDIGDHAVTVKSDDDNATTTVTVDRD